MAGVARSLGRLLPSTSALFVCDIQERFRPLIIGYPTVIDTARRAIRGATALGLPIVVTEQYPKALGSTVSELTEVLPPAHSKGKGPTTASMLYGDCQVLPPAYSKDSPPLTPGVSHHKMVAKTLFSMITPEVEEHLTKALPHVKQVLLLGIETHVCVLQTALDLLSKGYEVHLLVDGVSSQRESDRAIALQRLVQAGVLLSSSEMALFQLAGDAKAPAFKTISELVKAERPPHMVPLHSNL